MKQVLVTGGSGFLGSALVRRLVERGYKVSVLDDNSRGSPARLAPLDSEIEIIHGDIRDREAVQKAVQGKDWVFHLAFVNGTEFFYEDPGRVLDVGVRGHLNVMDACLTIGIEKFIYASSSEVYQTPPTVPTDESAPLSIPDVKNPRYSYGGGKLIGELMTLHSGRATEAIGERVIFRPHNFYGPDMGKEHVIPQLITKVLEAQKAKKIGKTVVQIQGDGSQTRSFCYVEDGAKGAVIAAEKGQNGEIYHIGTQDEITIRHLLDRIACHMGVKVDIESGSIPKGGTPRRCPEISKLRGLGYEPEWSLEAGLEKTVSWYTDAYTHNQGGAFR